MSEDDASRAWDFLAKAYETGALEQLVQRPEQAAPSEQIPVMPDFDDGAQKSVWVSVRLREMATEKFQGDQAFPAGINRKFNTLVAYLLWEYAGRPETLDNAEKSTEDA